MAQPVALALLTTAVLLVTYADALHVHSPRPEESDEVELQVLRSDRAAAESAVEDVAFPHADSFYHAKGDGSRASRALEAVMPILWVHVPKTGSSFLNTLINLPGACPGLPEDTWISSKTFGPRFLQNFTEHHGGFAGINKACPGISMRRGMFGHQGIGLTNDPSLKDLSVKGKLFTFLRQPEQRIISAYSDYTTESRRNGSIANLRNPQRSWSWTRATLPTNIRDFARVTNGCAVRMLTRANFSCGVAPLPTKSEVLAAQERLRNDFAFVGITEKWELSMCLLSKMYSVPCHSYQFYDTRPSGGTHNASVNYDAPRILGGFRDSYDGALYQTGLEIFHENLVKYQVSHSTCKACFQEAGLQ